MWRKKKKGKKEISREADRELTSADEGDNRLYLTIELEGRPYRALFDPGATCSLIGPSLAKRFAAHLLPSTPQIRAFDGSICKIAGILPLTLEIDEIERRIDFRAVPEIQQEMLMGTEFCKTFKLSLMQFERLWSANQSDRWYRFSSVETGHTRS